MTTHAERLSPEEREPEAGRSGRNPAVGTPGSEPATPGEDSGGKAGGTDTPLSEAIDRATAAVGQDDGKR